MTTNIKVVFQSTDIAFWAVPMGCASGAPCSSTGNGVVLGQDQAASAELSGYSTYYANISASGRPPISGTCSFTSTVTVTFGTIVTVLEG